MGIDHGVDFALVDGWSEIGVNGYCRAVRRVTEIMECDEEFVDILPYLYFYEPSQFSHKSSGCPTVLLGNRKPPLRPWDLRHRKTIP